MSAVFQRLLNLVTITTVAFVIGLLALTTYGFYKNHQECNAPKTPITVTAAECKERVSVECLELRGYEVRDAKCGDDDLFSYKSSARRDLETLFLFLFIPLLGVMTANYLFFGRATIWNRVHKVGERQSTPTKNSSDTKP